MKRKLLGLLALLLTTYGSFGQSFLEIDVSEGGTSLADAIQQANGFAGEATITILANTFTNSTISLDQQLIVGLTQGSTGLTIVGNGVTLDMGGNDRAFFIASGNVSIENLTISNGFARGGNGGDNGGGGAGMGGAIFVANPDYITSSTGGFSNPNLVLPSNVTLTNVTFFNNQAQGGAGGTSQSTPGGGGGMGGNGGNGYDNFEAVGGGGGGFGNDADGGNYDAGWNGGPGAMVFTPTSSAPNGGNGSDESNNGGTAGGGGGLGQTGDIISKGGGGGGANGDNGGDSDDGNGGNGGFGGGGGGASGYGNNAGNGGFGGGGGGAVQSTDSITAGNGGFGGGGGAGNTSGSGGFGGSAGYPDTGEEGGYAGAGAGLGGAIFLMNGANLTINGGSTFNQNSALPNSNNGSYASSAYGGNVFLGGTLTINVNPGQTTQIADLGGAGNTTDPNVSAHTSDPNANGDLVVTGGGTVELSGDNTNSGNITIHSGTLAATTGSQSLGTKNLTVGQNSGDNATFQTQFDSTFLMASGSGTGANAPIQLAVAAGSTGTLILNMNRPFSISASGINGGDGNATLVSQSVPVGIGLYMNLSGSLNFVVDGGQTAMEADNAANTFTGATTVKAQGQLITGGNYASLANTGSLLITGSSTLTLGQSEGINDDAEITIEDSTLEISAEIGETLGDLQSTRATIEFGGNQASLTFASINLVEGDLTINGWTSEAEIFVLNGITGNLTNIQFYDPSNTYLGYGALVGNSLTVVPEPTTAGLAVVGLLTFTLLHRRKK